MRMQHSNDSHSSHYEYLLQNNDPRWLQAWVMREFPATKYNWNCFTIRWIWMVLNECRNIRVFYHGSFNQTIENDDKWLWGASSFGKNSFQHSFVTFSGFITFLFPHFDWFSLCFCLFIQCFYHFHLNFPSLETLLLLSLVSLEIHVLFLVCTGA